MKPTSDLGRVARRASVFLLTIFLAAPAGAQERQRANLDDPIPILRRGEPGETRRYQVTRVNRALSATGAVMLVSRADGILDRVLEKEVAPGQWTERFTWKEYRFGSGAVGATSVEPSIFPAATGFSYQVDPRTTDLESHSQPVVGMPPGESASLFAVLRLDTWGFEAGMSELRKLGRATLQIGEDIELGVSPGADRIGAEAGELEGTYKLGSHSLQVVGLTKCGDGETCLRLAFSAEGNAVKQDTPMVSLDGHEYFSGSVEFSVEDGRLVEGDLWGPLVATFTQSGAALPIAGVMQEVRIREVALPGN